MSQTGPENDPQTAASGPAPGAVSGTNGPAPELAAPPVAAPSPHVAASHSLVGTRLDATVGAEATLDGAVAVSENLSQGATIAVPRELVHDDLESPRGRRIFLPIFLFVATCASTFYAGALHWNPALYLANDMAGRMVSNNWRQGVIYMAAVIGILLMHEMGHFLQTLRYRVPASLPFFIPVPILITGTMGAVISMEGSRADRKQLFDIGISGPWAGLIAALPIIWYGIKAAVPAQPNGEFTLGDPLIFKLMASYLRDDLPAGTLLNKNNPLLMAGWVGMLITGLNMMPISQLDGGHVIYGLFGQQSRYVARGFLITAILFIVFGGFYNWTLMLVVVILLGVDHPPTRDDNVPLGFWRTAFGLISLGIPILCFTPILI